MLLGARNTGPNKKLRTTYERVDLRDLVQGFDEGWDHVHQRIRSLANILSNLRCVRRRLHGQDQHIKCRLSS